jgi:hypothetical protein
MSEAPRKIILSELQIHEAHYRLFKEGKYHYVYVTSLDILEYQDYKIDLLESKDCLSDFERHE